MKNQMCCGNCCARVGSVQGQVQSVVVCVCVCVCVCVKCIVERCVSFHIGSILIGVAQVCVSNCRCGARCFVVRVLAMLSPCL